jgi:hypothetical protein
MLDFRTLELTAGSSPCCAICLPSGDAIATGKSVCVRGAELDRYPAKTKILREEGIQHCCIPLVTCGRTFGTRTCRRLKARARNPSATRATAIAVENALKSGRLTLKRQVGRRKAVSEEEIRANLILRKLLAMAHR